MSVYPFELDSDQNIIRIDDNITELGGEGHNQLRDAVFAIEGELGLGLSGSCGTLANRLNLSLNANGSIKSSALAAIGLVTLPIVNNQIADNAGIKENKLSLDHTTSDLYTIIQANKSLLDAINSFTSTIDTNFLNHLAGSTFISDGTTSARHVASHIDLNSIPNDLRDSFFSWTGLKNKFGHLRTASQVAEALLQINDDLVAHENSTTDAHVASAISVDVRNFIEIPNTANTVQKVFDYLENAEQLNIGEHRAVQHSNGIPAISRSQSMINPEGFGRDMVVPDTTVNAYLVNAPANTPVDNNGVGDDIIKFKPTNTNFIFDSQFSQVRIGDILRINYGNGISTSFEIESIRFVPGVEWVVRINGSNLFDAVDGLIDGYAGIASARIDRPQYDYNTAGVLALGSANSIPSTLYPNILGSLIVGNPKGATALGLGFDGNKINSLHYKLWLQLYPTGNPAESVVSLPFIDVTGDAGVSPGSYTLEKVVHSINNSFRKIGYNYRFIAFEYKGDLGIMLADPINKASFAIINGSNSSGTVITDIYTQNVVGDASDGDGFDAFGFGVLGSDIASPAYQASFIDSSSAQNPTKIITPVKRRFYLVDGRKLDSFAPTYLANSDGYWPASIISKISTGSSVEVTYKIDLDLSPAKLKPGKTIVVQPEVAINSSNYLINDYGRFIIKQVNFSAPCGTIGTFTTITVINGIHADGNGVSFSSDPGLAVRLYFSEDSVGFNDINLINSATTGINYHRYHEIYVSKQGTTFSHERARMKADQSESAPPSNLLRSDFWHIKSVSPKLRGYRDDTTTFNKYIRFYVTRYDSVSGEFDGYIGKRNPISIAVSHTGPLTTSRKNVVTRFYDETYVDYIDLEFKEINVGPTGSMIISDTNARYVDIEIFPSLRQNVENMLIGSCEVNWHATTNQNIIQCTKDLREFGSIGPIEFNDSAVNFISAGDRALHENGVIKGLQYIPSGITNTTGELFFNGGVVLVNGKIISVNNSSVTIPAISDGGATGVIVTWAICVNEFGYLQPIILTSSKDQIFAGLGSLYYVQSVTFEELINNRKDLTIIATVDAHISSITIDDSDINDLRRFVASEGANHPLVLTQNEFIGNFHSFNAVKQWVNRINGNNSIVRVKGNWTITSSVDLTGYDNPVIFDADGATITVTSLKGFLLGSNVTLRNFNFIYTPTNQSFTINDLVNTGNGCLYGITGVSNNISKLKIENCKFTSSLAYFRPPYINFETNNGQQISELKITDNLFFDSSTSALNAAIAIISLNNAASALPSVLMNSFIQRNICDRDQGIFISVSSSDFGRPGLNIINTDIEGNKCGAIGYFSTSVKNINLTQTDPSLGIVIKNNTCHYIETCSSTGKFLPSVIGPAYSFGFGSVIIKDNFCNWIHVFTQDGASSGANNEFSTMIIKDNILSAYDFTNYLLTNYVSDTSFNIAIMVLSTPTASALDVSVASISGNNISKGAYNAITYNYLSGIRATCSSNILSNIIKGFTVTGIIAAGYAGDAVRNYIISHNQIYRNGVTITSYISAIAYVSFPSTGLVQDNFFDSTTIDGSSTVLVTAFPVTWIYQRNKNQTVSQIFHSRQGSFSFSTVSVGNIIYGSTSPTTSVVVSNALTPSILIFGYTYTTHQDDVTWSIPLAGIVPDGVTITQISVIASESLLTNPRSIILGITTPNTSTVSSTTNLTTSITTYTLTADADSVVVPTTTGLGVSQVYISLSINHTIATDVTLHDFTITYRW
jgi:hypothetical protein